MTSTNFPIALPGAQDGNTLMWADPAEVEQAAQRQLRNISRLPWVEAVRVMPDVHLGKGATVGSVIAMRDAVSPAAVGVDIGCGMAAIKTSLRLADLPDDLHALRLAVEAVVPVGFNAHSHDAPVLKRERSLRERRDRLFERFDQLKAPGVSDRFGRALAQCGTLGGGNHFIELCAGDDESIWLTLHSGSRNIGKELAERHIASARTLEHNLGLPDRDLAVFLAGSAEMEAYLHDLWWAQDYALLNRHVMLATVTAELRRWCAEQGRTVEFEDPIQCHHNYVAQERYDGVDLIVTRKGAIRAGLGDLGLIPGSMGTGSYVVRGLGSLASLNSASHGAGRRMSRGEAKRRFNEADLAQQTAGIECRKDAGVVDEIPQAYKDIDQVMAAQADLVEVVARLHTLLCVKG
ncbi:MAG: RtcB family protein [Propionibacteriaceae bacterium]|jgi:tRNA-splicing ligase RtcB|nr:RtcB family protein [Propionibacteriaceae bacterium]